MHVIIQNKQTGLTIDKHGMPSPQVNRLISRLSEHGAGGIVVNVHPETREERITQYGRGRA